MRDSIPYFEELGLTYLHLMPLFESPEGNSDGGYAVSSYRRVNPALGTMDELAALAADLRLAGISLVVDFIFNHTSNEHEWARKAVAGEPGYEDFYLIFPDRTMPDAYEKTVREIFPDDHPGSFVQLPDGRWIWATFYHFQWDLNYANPAVFRAMAGEMLFLANQGVEILRMDAVAFIWKRLGTPCESLPEAHLLLRAFNAVLRMAAPCAAVQVRGDRAPRRGDRVHLARGVPALVQPAADGAHVGGARDPRPADAAAGARAPARAARRNRVGQLRAQPRRHRVDVRRRGCRGARHRRRTSTAGSSTTSTSAGSRAASRAACRSRRTRRPATRASRARPPHSRASRPATPEASIACCSPTPSRCRPAACRCCTSATRSRSSTTTRTTDDPATAGDSRWVHRPLRPVERYAQRTDAATDAGRVYAGLTALIRARQATPEFAGGELIGFDARASVGARLSAAGGGCRDPGARERRRRPRADRPDHPQRFRGDRDVDVVTGDEIDLERGIALPPHGFEWLRVTPV